MRNQVMLDNASWTATDLLSLTELHSTLLHTYHYVEASPPSQQNDDAQPANGPQDTHSLSLPSLNSLARAQDSFADDDADEFLPALPPQKRITSKIMKHWQPYTDARLSATERNKALAQLHACQQVDARPSVDAGAPAHSILGADMPLHAETKKAPRQRSITRRWASCHRSQLWALLRRHLTMLIGLPGCVKSLD